MRYDHLNNIRTFNRTNRDVKATSLQKLFACHVESLLNPMSYSFRKGSSFTKKAGMFVPKPHRRIDKRSVVYADNTDDVLDGFKWPPEWSKVIRDPKHSESQGSDRSSVPSSSSKLSEASKKKIASNKNLEKALRRLAMTRSMINESIDQEFESIFSKMKGNEESEDGKKEFIKDWMKRLHFVTLPVFQLGNWIPLVASRWYCTGHGCGLDQMAIETEKGKQCVKPCFRFLTIYSY